MAIEITVRMTKSKNEFKVGSFKRVIMAWCVAKGEFTKNEFKQAVLGLKAKYEVQSKMDDKTLCMAWWNEFNGKANVWEHVEQDIDIEL